MVAFGQESRHSTVANLEGELVEHPIEGRPCSRLRPYLLDATYLGGLLFVVPYLICSGRSRQLVDHFKRRMRDLPQREGDRPCVWVHGVSVGEIFSARPFLRRLAEEFPEWECVVSTTTRAGLEVAQRQFGRKRVFAYPLDVSFLVKRAFDRIRPQLVVIVEHELWPNFLGHAQDRGVPVAIVNGRMSDRSLRGYRWLSRFIAWPPPGVVRICVEDEISAEGFRRLGVSHDRIHVTGNFKFDIARPTPRASRDEIGAVARDWIVVGASTHKGEEEALMKAFRRLYDDDSRASIIIAPRRTERVAEVERVVQRHGFDPVRWSSRGKSNGTSGGKVFVVDSVGDLAGISALADAVFVGGSLVPFGGHNIIEPARLARPVLVGPHFQNFRQIVAAFTERDALIVARDADDLFAKLRELRGDGERARALGQRAAETVERHSGASERTIEVLRPIFEQLAAHSEQNCGKQELVQRARV